MVKIAKKWVGKNKKWAIYKFFNGRGEQIT